MGSDKKYVVYDSIRCEMVRIEVCESVRDEIVADGQYVKYIGA